MEIEQENINLKLELYNNYSFLEFAVKPTLLKNYVCQ